MATSGSQEKKSIPRFASFKPQPAPPGTDRPSEPSSRERVKSEDKSRHRSTHRSKRTSEHRGRSRSSDRRSDHRDSRHLRKEISRRDKEHVRKPTPPSSDVSRDLTRDLSDIYVIDRKGDKFTLVYGTIHRYSVPHYYRIGRGRVLGLPPNYRIDRETIGENEIVVRSETARADSSKSRSKRLLSKPEKSRPRLLRVRPTSFANDPIAASKDFVPLSDSQWRQHNGIASESDAEDEKYGYRSIHGKLKPEEGLPNDLELLTDSELSGEEAVRQDPDWDIKQRNVELSRDVAEHPTDIDAWLRLIDHQETVLRGSSKQSSPLTSAEHQSLADIKISLYEKALKKIGQGPGRDRLLIGLLEEGTKLWDTKKVLAQWQSTLKANSQYINLWVKYLDFRQTEFLNFTHRQCLATFTECLRLNKMSPDGPEKTCVQIYLFLRLTLFLREAGYMEQATGLWQGFLELAFYRPQGVDVHMVTDEVLSAFTDFWDSEVVRIGEPGAKGWKNSTAALFEPKTFQPQGYLNPKSMFASWTACEQERMLIAQLPARSLDEPEDDPYRVVLASDLSEILSLASLPNSTSELIEGFTYFSHLPPIITVNNCRTTGCWMGDSFLRNEISAASIANLDDWLPTTTKGESGISPTIFPHQYFIHDYDTYFANPENWFSSFNAWLKATSDPACSVVRDWTRRTLRLLVDANSSDEHLAEYTVAVEFACNAKEAKKYAKSLLKKRPSSLRLYNAYALMERRDGNHAAADHVWATAISMSKSFPNQQRVDSVILWHTWIWELLEARNIAHAAHLLVSMPQNNIDLKTFPDASQQSSFSPANQLKLRNYLLEVQESAIADRKTSIIKACSDCQAILTYLIDAQDLNKALEAYTATINRLSALPNPDSDPTQTFISYATELLHQARAKLLYYHLRTSTLYKPSAIRSILNESIASFPHNTIMLSLFAWNESRFRIEERVRGIMRDITTTTTTTSSPFVNSNNAIPVTSHLFSIYTEFNRPTYAGSTLHSVRAAFEKAIGDQNSSYSSRTSTGRSSISLWKLYILFELSFSDITRAKSVFYRAMRACPWSKDILMLAFTHLREDIAARKGENGKGMSFHELRHVYNVLVEKELRIHIDIERELDEMAVKMERERGVELGMPISMPDDGGSGDEMR
ncbi:NRDE-2, necessary for RNA interference-domain-containing protein [Aspergillus spinulosporus]